MEYFAVYLAGKISKNGWRSKLVIGLRDAADEASDVLTADYKNTIIDGLLTSGPYFISCDHGCYHGDNSHGVGADGDTMCSGIGIPASIVPKVCMKQIAKSNFVFAYIDSTSCYGTLCEIGYAIGKGKPVAVMFANHKLKRDMWFIAEMAHIVFNVNGSLLRTNIQEAEIIMYAQRIAYNLRAEVK